MTRQVLLLTIGAEPLPETTPIVPVTVTQDVDTHVAGPPATPAGFAVMPTVDGIRAVWTQVTGSDMTYELQRAPDAGGVAGEFATLYTGPNTSYSSNESARTWWRAR